MNGPSSGNPLRLDRQAGCGPLQGERARWIQPSKNPNYCVRCLNLTAGTKASTAEACPGARVRAPFLSDTLKSACENQDHGPAAGAAGNKCSRSALDWEKGTTRRIWESQPTTSCSFCSLVQLKPQCFPSPPLVLLASLTGVPPRTKGIDGSVMGQGGNLLSHASSRTRSDQPEPRPQLKSARDLCVTGEHSDGKGVERGTGNRRKGLWTVLPTNDG